MFILFFMILFLKASEKIIHTDSEFCEFILDFENDICNNTDNTNEFNINKLNNEIYYKDIYKKQEADMTLNSNHSFNIHYIKIIQENIHNYYFRDDSLAWKRDIDQFHLIINKEKKGNNIEVDHISKFILEKRLKYVLRKKEYLKSKKIDLGRRRNVILKQGGNFNHLRYNEMKHIKITEKESRFSIKYINNEIEIVNFINRNPQNIKPILQFSINFYNVYSGNCLNNIHMNCKMCEFLHLFEKITYNQVLDIFFTNFPLKNTDNLLYIKSSLKWISRLIFHINDMPFKYKKKENHDYIGKNNTDFLNEPDVENIKFLFPSFYNALEISLMEINMSIEEFNFKYLLWYSIKMVCKNLMENFYKKEENGFDYIEFLKNRNFVKHIILHMNTINLNNPKYIYNYKKIVLAEAIVLNFCHEKKFKIIGDYIQYVSNLLFEISHPNNILFNPEKSDMIIKRIINFSIKFVVTDETFGFQNFYYSLTKDELQYIITFLYDKTDYVYCNLRKILNFFLNRL